MSTDPDPYKQLKQDISGIADELFIELSKMKSEPPFELLTLAGRLHDLSRSQESNEEVVVARAESGPAYQVLPPCWQCGEPMRPTGSCFICDNCHATSGCDD